MKGKKSCAYCRNEGWVYFYHRGKMKRKRCQACRKWRK